MNNTDIIKDKLNILDVVGAYVKLQKAGKTYKGKSPFTHEKTPSFFVSPEKGFFYCFSSGKGGDIFTFIQEIERVEFKDALKILADKAGVELSRNPLKSGDEHNRRRAILDTATKWYEINLRKNSSIVDHLISRGLSKETIIKFRVGYAKDSWDDCYNYLKSRKYTDVDIESVGLIVKKDTGGYYDRFRSRIMFPLMDARGRVVGFSGRIHGDDSDKKGAKYVNSPDGPLFDKSKLLYGYHTAKSTMSKDDYCILVEGQFDVLLAQQSGYTNTVAISGTGLTDDHISMIKRFTDTVFLALDSDNAGIKATRRSVLASYKHGMNVKVIVMPQGMDPADLINHSKEQWDVCVADAQDYLDYRLEVFSREEHSFKEKKQLVDNDLFTFAYLMKSAMIQDKIMQKLALFLGVTVEAVRKDFAQFSPDVEKITGNTETLVKPKQKNIDGKKHVLHLWQYTLDKNYPIDDDLNRNITNLFNDTYGQDINEALSALDETQKNMHLFIFEEQFKDNPETFFALAVYRAISEERIRQIDSESSELLVKIRQAEGAGNSAELVKYMKENQELLLLKTDLSKNHL